jgi:hypothetical protein
MPVNDSAGPASKSAIVGIVRGRSVSLGAQVPVPISDTLKQACFQGGVIGARLQTHSESHDTVSQMKKNQLLMLMALCSIQYHPETSATVLLQGLSIVFFRVLSVTSSPVTLGPSPLWTEQLSCSLRA